MSPTSRTASAEAAELEFRLRTVRTGIQVTLVMASAIALYAALTWDRPHRALLLAVCAVAIADAAVIHRLPHRDLVLRNQHDPVLLAWNCGHVVMAAVLASFDGGPTSPLVSIFFVSVAFAAVSLRLRDVVVVALLDIGALLATAIATGDWPALLVPWAAALLVIAVVGTTIAGERWQRGQALQSAHEEMLRRIARVVEFRDGATGEHVERMSDYCALIAARLGFTAAAAQELRIASAMHDVGKVAIPDSILLKPGPLTPEERDVMERHTEVGHQMLAGSEHPVTQLAAEIALTHHERWDGGGYPQGLHGEAIPLAGRIVAVADAFDAMTTDRVYRRAMPVDDALDILAAGRGTQFDPAVLDAFTVAFPDVVAVGGLLPEQRFERGLAQASLA